MSFSLNDTSNFLGLTTIFNIDGEDLITSTVKLSEHIPNAEQVDLIDHIFNQGALDASRYPALSSAVISHKLEIFASDGTLLENWTTTISPKVSGDETANLFADMATALANYSGQ